MLNQYSPLHLPMAAIVIPHKKQYCYGNLATTLINQAFGSRGTLALNHDRMVK